MLTNIYFLRYDDATIKIGRSINPEERKQALQTGSIDKLYILYVIENVPPSFELHIHEVCQRYFLRGEFFLKECIDHLRKNPDFRRLIKAFRRKV